MQSKDLGIDTLLRGIDTNRLRRGQLRSRMFGIDTLLRGIDTEVLRQVKKSTQEVRYRYRAATDDKTKAF